MKRKRTICLTILMAGILVFLMSAAVFAEDETFIPEEQNYRGKLIDLPGPDITKDKRDAGVINYLFAKYYGSDIFFTNANEGFYYCSTIYKGSGQCWGYAEKCRKLFGTGGKKKTIRKKVTKKNLYKYLKNCRPGTHLRFSRSKGGNGYHSICVLGVTKTRIWFTDTAYSNNPIFFYKVKLSDLAAMRGDQYMVWKIEPTGHRMTNKVDLAASSYVANETVELAWLPVKGAKNYTVYRSTKKKSGYKKLKTVKTPYFTDRNTKIGKKYWYKVKPSNGKKSKAVKAVRAIMSPTIKVSYNVDGKPVLKWEKVKGAYKYVIFRMNSKGIMKKLKSTKKTSFTFKNASADGDFLVVRSYRKGLPEAKSAGTAVEIGYPSFDW